MFPQAVLLTVNVALVMSMVNVMKNPEVFEVRGSLFSDIPNYCHFSEFAHKSKTYTARKDPNCCSYVKTKDKCCLRGRKLQCVCDPHTDCLMPKSPNVYCSSFLYDTGMDDKNYCPYPGYAEIIFRGSFERVCNAVYTMATVNAIYKATFLTTSFCGNLIEKAFEYRNQKYDIKLRTQTFPINPPRITVFYSKNEVTYLNIDRAYVNFISRMDSCNQMARFFDSRNMIGIVNASMCVLLDVRCNDVKLQYSISNVLIYEGDRTPSCPNSQGHSRTVCFRVVEFSSQRCLIQSGSPVYCMSDIRTIKRSWVYVGSVAYNTVCDVGTDIKVLPYTG